MVWFSTKDGKKPVVKSYSHPRYNKQTNGLKKGEATIISDREEKIYLVWLDSGAMAIISNLILHKGLHIFHSYLNIRTQTGF